MQVAAVRNAVDIVAVALFFFTPFLMIGWGVYVFRKWRGRWRYAALLPAAVILGDAVLLWVDGAYAGGNILGLHFAALLMTFLVSGIHRGWTIREKLPGPRRAR